MKRFLCVMFAMMVTAVVAGCGGGSDGSSGNWNSGSESNPSATVVDVSGNAVTSIAPNGAVIAKGAGLLQNGIYNVSIIKPDGTSLFDQNLLIVTDGSGNLSDTILAYAGNDTQSQAAMVVDTDKSGFKTTRINYKSVQAGTYTAYVCKESEATCDASTASATTTLTVDNTRPYIFSADSTGAGVNSFRNGAGDVYAVIMNGTPGTTYGLRVVSNSFQVFSDGSPLPTDASGTTETCVADANGNCIATLIWTDAAATLTNSAALYDIVADAGNNGNWDSATDFMDAAGYVPGFAIQEPSSAITSNIAAVTVGGTDRVSDIACTSAGSGYCTFVDIFSGIDVYGYLNPKYQSLDPHDIGYKFIILHSDSLADGDTLTPIQGFGYDYTVDPLQWGCTNEGRILLWPASTHVAGCYDVVLDVNQNLKYDSGIDFVDGYAGTCGFIIPGVEGAPTITIDTLTDGNGTIVASGGSTTSTTATVSFTATLTGASLSRCEIRWAAGQSSNVAQIDVTNFSSGGTMTTQPINLFNGTNTILVTCVDDGNKAGSGTATIESSNTATQDIHFQASLVWTQPSSGSFDMDLHLVTPGGTWFTDNDCYYANCRGSGNATVGAILNVDCISDCTGPENIWMPNSNPLTAGNYRVCVNPFNGEGLNVQVSVYDMNGALIDTVTRTSLSGAGTGSTNGGWHVGNFSCSAGTSGNCTWSRVDTFTAGAGACAP